MGSSLVGSTLGRFRVDRLIGRGGMGAVYAAFDGRLEREVALKVLNDDVDVVVQKKRLMREARIAAKLTHPNIATVFEVDELDGRLCIVMELLEGCSLRKILSLRRIGVEEGTTIARDMARALARAHLGGVVHRDIKPENIFVTTPSPDAMLTKVLDFGLARQRALAGVTAEATFTASRGDMWGTPGYVSPEQAHGDDVDIRTDIFSFGVVVYEMLAGIKPFRGENAVATMIATTRQQERALRELNPEVPPEVEAIIRRCLLKSREGRFADGSELSAALEAYVRGAPSSRSHGSLVASSPQVPIVSHEDVGAELVLSQAIENHRTTGGSAAIARTTDEEAPTSEQQRRDRVTLIAAIGSGIGLAVIVVLVALSWSSPGPRPRVRATATTVAATALDVRPPPAVSVLAPSDGASDPAVDPPSDATLPAASAAPTTVVRPAAPPPPHARKKPADCVEPFKVDSKGVKIPKLYCL